MQKLRSPAPWSYPDINLGVKAVCCCQGLHLCKARSTSPAATQKLLHVPFPSFLPCILLPAFCTSRKRLEQDGTPRVHSACIPQLMCWVLALLLTQFLLHANRRTGSFLKKFTSHAWMEKYLKSNSRRKMNGRLQLFGKKTRPCWAHRRYPNVSRNAETTPKGTRAGLAGNFLHTRFPKLTSKLDCNKMPATHRPARRTHRETACCRQPKRQRPPHRCWHGPAPHRRAPASTRSPALRGGSCEEAGLKGPRAEAVGAVLSCEERKAANCGRSAAGRGGYSQQGREVILPGFAGCSLLWRSTSAPAWP